MLPIERSTSRAAPSTCSLRLDRGIAAAQAFFRKAFASHPNRPPQKVTLDGHWPSHRALRLLRREHPVWRRVHVRTCQYLNNIVEQDHRAIRRRCAPMLGFKSVKTAAVTISGIELAHRIRKRQFVCQPTDRRESLNLRTAWFAAVMV